MLVEKPLIGFCSGAPSPLSPSTRAVVASRADAHAAPVRERGRRGPPCLTASKAAKRAAGSSSLGVTSVSRRSSSQSTGSAAPRRAAVEARHERLAVLVAEVGRQRVDELAGAGGHHAVGAAGGEHRHLGAAVFGRETRASRSRRPRNGRARCAAPPPPTT